MLIDRVIVTDDQVEIRYLLRPPPMGDITPFAGCERTISVAQRAQAIRTSWPMVVPAGPEHR
jgi:hypothetical protein